MRDLGEMGESTLRNWAAQVGVTANKANQDKRGWDFILEFPIENLPKNEVALDKMIDPIQCFVQVKATDNNRGRLSVKLSNWVRLVKTSFPAFFLVLDFNNTNKCQKAYLIHIWEEEIKRVLKKLRQISTEVDSFDLNKKSLSFKWNENNLLSSLDGEGLLKKIQEYINDFKTYSKRKKELIDNVGYKGGRKKIDLQLLVPDSHKELDPKEFFIDWSLGLLEEVKVDKSEIKDLRFNIEAPKPEEIIEEGSKIEIIPKPVSKDILWIKESEGGNEVRVPANLHVPSGVGEIIDLEDVKYLFELFEGNNIILIPNKNSLKYNIHIPDVFENYNLSNLSVIAKLILFFSKLKEGNAKEISIFYSSEFIGKAQTSNMKIPDKFIKWAHLINKTTKIANYFDILDQVEVKVIELWNQEIKLNIMLMILNIEEYGSKKIRFEFDCDGEIKSGSEFCVPNVTGFTLGEYKIFAAVGYIGEAITLNNEQEKNYRLEVDKIEIVRKQLLRRGEELPKSISEFIKVIEDRYIEEYNILHLCGQYDKE
ncbi:hypothetical protein [Halanaerobacter jeridensis]|uniref:DUF4365 domain-containing protein n=1 Tax=Halanaerobacter jeridensis TaxID=706427 RepID=A0A938XV93_9FIRM|nr:hypothetical protein [Halanaerobacter jeridensis]MBM7558168.1 hypothetical protein [Halanaerobacter jeridensis]